MKPRSRFSKPRGTTKPGKPERVKVTLQGGPYDGQVATLPEGSTTTFSVGGFHGYYHKGIWQDL